MSTHAAIDSFLAAFYCFVALFYTVLIKRRSSRQSGCQMVHSGSPLSMHWWNHLVFRIMRVVILIACLTIAIFPQSRSYLGIFPAAEIVSLRIIGIIILCSGFSLAIISNLALGSVWRSGIDTQTPRQLVMHGVYARSRNPGFMGVALGQVGFFLALPSGFTFACLLIGLSSIRLQIYLEEQHLREVCPHQYQDYCKLVRRWL